MKRDFEKKVNRIERKITSISEPQPKINLRKIEYEECY